MAIKKKTTKPGPKALLMKKSLPELKRKAKALKIKGYSTKKKEQIVQSIILAEARKKRSKAPKKRTLASKPTIQRKRGAKPNRLMKKPVQMRGRGNRGMSQRYTEAEFLGSAYYNDRTVLEAAELLRLLGEGKMTRLAKDYFYRDGNFYVAYNEGSGIVFLRDEDMNVLINDGGVLELFISTPYEGVEGTYDELMEQYEDLHPEDQEYLDNFR